MFISTYYESMRTNQKKRKAKKIILKIIFFALLAALFIFVIWPKLIYGNMSTDILYSPEILQTYIARSEGFNNIDGESVITFTKCSQNGDVSAIFENYNDYGVLKWKVKLEGKIARKSKSSRINIVWNSNTVIIGSRYKWENISDLVIKNDYKKLVLNDKYDSRYVFKYDSEEKYAITSYLDLKKLNNSQSTYVLKRNIILTDREWTPIEGFSGTLIGNGYAIKNLSITSDESNVGFFSVLSGSVYDLTFENATINVSGSNQNVGVLCGAMEGDASNISVSGTVNAPDSTNVGGIIGSYEINDDERVIENLTSSASVIGLDCVGGIIGTSFGSETDQTLEFRNLKNEGHINGNGMVGGIFGSISFTEDDWYFTNNYYFNDLTNSGNVNGSGDRVGGIFGHLYVFTEGGNSWVYISRSQSSGNISGNEYVGGIAGYIEKNTNHSFHGSASSSCISDYTVTGEITGTKNYDTVAGYSSIIIQ